MYLNAVKYKDQYLAPGSEAFELYHSKDKDRLKKLDEHLAKLDQAKRKLEGLK